MKNKYFKQNNNMNIILKFINWIFGIFNEPKIQKRVPLEFNELFVGMLVIDEDNDIGEIINIQDMYNIEIEYYADNEKSGRGLYCLSNCCNDKLYTTVVE